MKFRIALYSVLGLLIVGIVIGTFYDLAISTALCSNPNDLFLHAATAFGLEIPYMFFGLLGGILFRVTLDNKEQKTWLRWVLFILSVFCTLAGVYYAAHENFSVNGLYNTGIQYTIISLSIALLFNGVAFALGFVGMKGNENKNLWIVVVILVVSIIISQLAGVTGLKNIFRRPRFRSIGNGIEFFPWYIPNPNYKSFITETITKEEFKSFPSGHSSISSLMMFYAIFVPLLFPKRINKNLHFALFFVGLAYYIFVASVRIFAGAHFLSDVCFGGLITIVFTIIPYEIIKKKKLLEIDN